MRQTVDARGLACPLPVVLTLKALEAGADVVTIVDNNAAVENVTRLARARSREVQVETREDGTYLSITQAGGQGDRPESQSVTRPAVGTRAARALVFLVRSDCFAQGPAELGERLMSAFFQALLEVDSRPKTMVFVGSGVKLVVEGARTLDDLRALEARGVEVLACGTCLSYFALTERVAVGRVSNMFEIAGMLTEAERVVSL